MNTKDELFAAIAAVQPGELIYVDDSAVIDLSGEQRIALPAGLTLASGRGRNASLGALIFTDSFSYPLFETAGDDVRLTGLRLRGPNPDILDHAYTVVPHSSALSTHDNALQVDNCELDAWGTSAISFSTGASAGYVHHNYIHRTRRAGLGYGVVLNQADAIIEANLFDRCRHFIAATGRFGTSYEARYNIVLEHHNGHAFDMHGARDFDKRATSAIWRFDEGEGLVTADGSISYYHTLNPCDLVNMDASQSWVSAVINTGLAFDGVDDFLQCGHDSSLVSSEGTVYFWLQRADLGQGGDILRLSNTGATDVFLISLDAAGHVHLSITDDGNSLIDLQSQHVIDDSHFHHVALTQDGSQVHLYFDGQPESITGSNGAAWSGHISLAESRIAEGFNGVLDEMRIYDRALEAGEVDLHYSGNPDIAGNTIKIHHNTFRGTEQASIVIRGKPANGAWIHHNWFHSPDSARAVVQYNATGNMFVESNHYGDDVPVGTILPVSQFSLAPASGTAPLQARFDASASFDPLGAPLSFQWDFANGDLARVTSSNYSYTDPGHYLVGLRSRDARGVCVDVFKPVEISPSSSENTLDFWIKDSYPGSLTGYYRKQALIDGQVVWQDDVAENEGWQHVSINVDAELAGKDSAELSFRAVCDRDILNAELIELDVFVDDVALFGSAGIIDADFENASGWSYTEDSSRWSGRYTSREAHSGIWSYVINHPYLADCYQDTSAQISQRVRIKSPNLRAEWRFDDDDFLVAIDQSRYGNHAQLVNMSPGFPWPAGVKGHALRFDGVDDYVEVAQPAALNSSQGSLSLWVKFSAPSAVQTILQLSDASGENQLILQRRDDGSLGFIVRKNGSTVIDLHSDTQILDNNFHHLVWVQDGSSLRLYIDGVEQNCTGQNASDWTAHLEMASLRIGAGSSSYYSGLVDELRIVDYAMSAAQILADYRSAFLLGSWNFNEGQGDLAEDASNFANDARLQNMDAQTAWLSGVDGQALQFDGQDDLVDLGDATLFKSAQGSIEFWMKANTFDANMDILNIFQDGYENYFLLRRDANNQLYVRIEQANIGVVNVTSVGKILDQNFHHIVVTQEGFGVQIFIDGGPAGAAGTNGAYWTEHLNLTGAWLGGGHWEHYNGVIDELKIYPRALRIIEILEHAQR